MPIFVPIDDGELRLRHKFQPASFFAFDTIGLSNRSKMTIFDTDPPFTYRATGRARIDIETNGFHHWKPDTWPDIIAHYTDRPTRTV